jgi:sugar-phosphatase
VALVTSAPRALAEARMRSIGLAMLSMVIAAEDVVHGKPAPGPYLNAARALGLPASKVLVFEDAEVGLQSARAAGMRAVIVGDYSGPESIGLPRITDFRALVEQIDPSREFPSASRTFMY